MRWWMIYSLRSRASSKRTLLTMTQWWSTRMHCKSSWSKCNSGLNSLARFKSSGKLSAIRYKMRAASIGLRAGHWLGSSGSWRISRTGVRRRARWNWCRQRRCSRGVSLASRVFTREARDWSTRTMETWSWLPRRWSNRGTNSSWSISLSSEVWRKNSSTAIALSTKTWTRTISLSVEE
jgi:hypothetical protein